MTDYAPLVRDGFSYLGGHKVVVDRYYALKDGLLSGRLYQQITIEFPSNALRGLEVLARWRHPDFGLVSPSDFIPLVEQVIDTIGLSVQASLCVLSGIRYEQ
ncbi:EAL domain-containing protein [Vibrio sp. ES.051]|uniref:EAL domain-containing protein n=1 Tax=Vibrio sp. ES.051 TaxID=1761909 RepID=UPI000BF52669|nr:EAL domain-containing protein [Vibrio sp. ES.051]